MDAKTKYRICFGLLALPLLLSVFQFHLKLFPEGHLHGDYAEPAQLVFSAEQWFSGDFQAAAQLAAYQRMAFRPALVRLNCEIEYSIFKTVPGDLFAGKREMLFLKTNYRCALGQDFVGDSTLDKRVQKLKVLEQFLRSKNVGLLTVVTPNKIRAYPELLPRERQLPQGIENNYFRFLHFAKQYQLDLVDMNELVPVWRQGASHPLWPNLGYHWSDYGALHGFNYLLSAISQRKGLNYPRPVLNQITQSDSVHSTDDDLAQSMNLIFSPRLQPLGFPQYDFSKNKNAIKPRVLVVSDSYWWKIYDQQLHQQCFAPGSPFMYYFDEVYSSLWEGNRTVSDFDIVREVENCDFVLLLSNESNLHRFPFGFEDYLIKAYQAKGELGQSFNLSM